MSQCTDMRASFFLAFFFSAYPHGFLCLFSLQIREASTACCRSMAQTTAPPVPSRLSSRSSPRYHCLHDRRLSFVTHCVTQSESRGSGGSRAPPPGGIVFKMPVPAARCGIIIGRGVFLLWTCLLSNLLSFPSDRFRRRDHQGHDRSNRRPHRA